MVTRLAIWSPLAFLPAFLIAGLSYWSIPLKQLSLPSSLSLAGYAAVFLCAYAARAFGRVPALAAIALAGAALPAVVIVRIVVDVARHPDTHGLAGIEVAIALFVGLACAVPGGLIGMLASPRRARAARA